MNGISAVLAMQRYIKAHLDEAITLADLARVSRYSPWYAHRLFVQNLNMPPAEYIRKFRLAQSALKLRDEQVKVADVAFVLGFGSVDGYQRAFYREFGCNPSEYAQSPIPLRLFIPYEVEAPMARKEKSMKMVKNVFIQVVEKSERDVIIKRGVKAADYFAYCEEVGCDVWGILTSIKSISNEPVSMWLPKKLIPAGTSEYVQGVEVALGYQGPVPEGFEVIRLPKCKYLMFRGEPFNEENYCEAIEQLQAAIEKYDPTLGGFKWDTENPRIQLEPQGTRGYIELLAIK